MWVLGTLDFILMIFWSSFVGQFVSVELKHAMGKDM